jgi:hypothetical protein
MIQSDRLIVVNWTTYVSKNNQIQISRRDYVLKQSNVSYVLLGIIWIEEKSSLSLWAQNNI